MYLDKSHLTESGYVAEDLLDGKPEDISRKCLVVKQTVQDGDFKLEEALQLYEVSEKEYKKFLAESLIAELQTSFDLTSKKVNMIYSIEVFAEVYNLMLSKLDKESMHIIKHFQSLSKAIKEDKVKV